MNKRVFGAIIVVLLILAIWPAYHFGVALGLWQPLGRPFGVPSKARYVVTVTRSAWFDCAAGNAFDVCKAWDDAGRLIAQGKYRLEKERRAATASELRPSMVQVYPGHPELSWIYLYGDSGIFSRTLVPVNEAGEPLERFGVHTQGR